MESWCTDYFKLEEFEKWLLQKGLFQMWHQSRTRDLVHEHLGRHREKGEERHKALCHHPQNFFWSYLWCFQVVLGIKTRISHTVRITLHLFTRKEFLNDCFLQEVIDIQTFLGEVAFLFLVLFFSFFFLNLIGFHFLKKISQPSSAAYVNLCPHLLVIYLFLLCFHYFW